MTVGAQEPQILGSVVVVLTIDVIDFERDFGTEPLPKTADLALGWTANFDKSSAQFCGGGAWPKFSLFDEKVCGRLLARSARGPSVVSRTAKVGYVELVFTNPPGYVCVIPSSLAHAKTTNYLSDGKRQLNNWCK
jgi:hypothetical protein